MKPTLYLAGPINGCTDSECMNWREAVKSSWGGDCIDPMSRDYRGVEDAAYREIVDADKYDIRRADIVLVNYDKPSVGTSMEVMYAWSIGRLVYVVARPDAAISPWLRYHSARIFYSFGEALEHLGRLDQ